MDTFLGGVFMDQAERIRIGKMLIFIMGLVILLGIWTATQEVAASCDYNPILGMALHVGDISLYPPYKFFVWQNQYGTAMPHILNTAENTIYISVFIGFVICAIVVKKSQKDISHGSADWANARDVVDAKIAEKSGVVLGVNPFTKKILRHDGPEHILLMAPTRQGKGICVIIPTCFLWKHSIFVLDVKGENWKITSWYRKHILKQKVMNFSPMSTDGSTLRWNPLAEIHFREDEEYGDIQNIVDMIVDPEGKGKPDFWDKASSSALIAVILHLLYSHYQENKPLPTMTDIASFFTNPSRSVDQQMTLMMSYPHISKEEFFSDENILQKLYKEYIKDFKPFNEELGCDVHTLDELKEFLRGRNVDFTEEPFARLLVHPRVASGAAEMLQRGGDEKSGVISSAKSFFNMYQNPIIEQNTAVSDFKIEDLLDDSQAVSFYLGIPIRDLNTLKPLVRLLLNSILRTLIREIEDDVLDEEKKKRKQRLLLMLDEFPQFGKLDMMEKALAVCAGYGIKACVVCQDQKQLNSAYGKDNSIISNCHIKIYFTPTHDSETAPCISKLLGKKTISNESRSQQGSLFKGSTTTSSIARDLMEPDEVLKIPFKKELIFIAGHKPVYGNKLMWYKHDFFLRKKGIAPLFSDTASVISDFKSLFDVHAAESAAKKRKREAIRQAKIEAGIISVPVKTINQDGSDSFVEPNELEMETVSQMNTEMTCKKEA